MRIVVNDSSALIDLKKGNLLEILVELPFEFVVADALLADELLSFTKPEVDFMRRRMTVLTLDGEEMVRVGQLQASSPALSVHDCSALILAKRQSDCILLTGDKRLRSRAEADEIECHGVLWIIEEVARAKLAPIKLLLKALETWRDDTSVRLPPGEVSQAIARLKR